MQRFNCFRACYYPTSQTYRAMMYNYNERPANVNYNDISHPVKVLVIGQNVASFVAIEIAAARTVQAFKVAKDAFLAAKTSTSLVTKYPAVAEIEGTAERIFLMPGQVIDRYGAMGGKWFSTPGTSYGARSIPPGLSPYTQFKVLKPFEVQKSLALPSMFSGQAGFGIQFQSPVGADILIKRGIITPIKSTSL